MKYYLEIEKIKMDGLIIYNSKSENIYKLKPLSFLTADLLFDDNLIYRCVYINNKWEKINLRTDKEFPNSKKVVQKIEYINNNYWTLDDLAIYLDKYNHTYYQLNDKLDLKTKHYFEQYKVNLNRTINNFLKKDIKSVLDLACGFLNNNLWSNDKLFVTGVDIDIKIINAFEKKFENTNKNLFIMDFTKKIDNKISCCKIKIIENILI